MSKSHVEKAADSVQKLAVITLHPYLPSKAEQMDAAREWGVPDLQLLEMDLSPIWIDDVRKVKTTYWPSRLPKRQELLTALKHYDMPHWSIFFANPLCVGFSKSHALSVIEVIFNAKAAMYVHDAGREYRSEKQLTKFWVEHGRQLRNAQMRKYRS
ncbi:MAG: hypothetical protein ACU0AU_06875 [Cognatishimia activa]